MKSIHLSSHRFGRALLVSLLAVISPVLSQESTADVFADPTVGIKRPGGRDRAVARIKALEDERATRTRAKAKARGLKLRIEKPDGSLMELVDFDGEQPVYLKTLNLNAAISTGANLVQVSPYLLNGSGIIAGVWDGGSVRSTHQEFANGNRVTVLDGAAANNHATHVGGTIGAQGTSAVARGMATNISIASYDWNSDQSEMTSRAATSANQFDSKIYLSNHSYGYADGWDGNEWIGNGTDQNAADHSFGQYGGICSSLDSIAYNSPYYSIFWAAGNDRSNNPSTGSSVVIGGATVAYNPAIHPPGDGVYRNGFENIGSHGNAKNLIVIGAANDAVTNGVRDPSKSTLTSFSSVGPTDDGRIKPDLVANGASLTSTSSSGDTSYTTMSGTSMASPNATGSAALVIDQYKRLFNSAMRASTLKALLIHTATDIGNPGPDYRHGWGLVDTKKAVDLVRDHHAFPLKTRIIEDQVTTSITARTHSFLWDGASPLSATVCWTDPAGTSTTAHDSRTARLVNNLNLKIIAPNGTEFFPYVMPFVGTWTVASMSQNATTGINNTDNVETVNVQSPGQVGTWQAVVSYTGPLTNASQGYGLVLSGTADSPNTISLNSPNGGEIFYHDSSYPVTWVSNVAGNVSIQLLKGGSLHSVISANEANDGSFTWAIPSSLTAATDYTIRVSSVSNSSLSDTSAAPFSIAVNPWANALDTLGIAWNSPSAQPWFSQTTTTNDGVDAARSGAIDHDGSSALEATITGAGTLTFWWKVSSESGWDFLRFDLNGVEQTGSLAKISGEVNWVQKTVVIPAGSNTIRWTYYKDGSVVAGSDAAWVDQVVFTPTPVQGTLAVTSGNLTSSGAFGGAFSPSSLQYTLSNPGNSSINWTAAKTAAWVNLSASSGTLAAGANTTVTVSINGSANTLNVGNYTDTVTFANTTNGAGNTTRGVSLAVNAIAASVNLSNLLQTFDGAPKPVSVGTTPSGLSTTVTYAGSAVVPTNAGTYAVVASITQPNYTGSASGSLVISKAAQTIAFGSLSNVADNATPFALTATATSGMAVSFASSNPAVATVSGNTLSIVGAGTTTITASQAGNTNYNAATSVPQTLTVVSSNPLASPGSPYKVLVGQSLSLNGSASQPSFGQTISTYEWDLNNDNTFGDVVGATPSAISYTTLVSTWGMVQGLNTIKLKITDSADKTSTVSTTVELIASLTWDANGLSSGQTNGAGAWLSSNLWWDGSANTNWVSGSNAIFGGPNTSGGAVTLASPTTVNSMSFNQFTGTYTLGTAGQALTINGGITMAATSGAVSLSASPILLGATQTWTNASANALTLSVGLNNSGHNLTVNGSGTFNFAGNANAVVSGSGGITVNGNGRLTLGGGAVPVHTYSGTTTLNGGVTMVSNNNLGSGNLIMNGGVIESYWASNFVRALGEGSGQVQITGGASGFGLNGSTGASVILGNNATNEAVWGSAFFNPSTFVLQTSFSQGSSSLNFQNRIDLNGSNRTIQVSGGVTGAATATLSGIVRNSSGTAGIIKTGNGTLFLTANNTYNGTTTVNGGLLDFGAITLTSFGGGSGRNISVASGSSVRRNTLDNAFLNRLVETSSEITVMTGNTANSLNFGASAGANLPNAFLGCWSSNGAKTEYSGIFTPAVDAYRFGSPSSSGLLGITSAMTGTQGLIVGGSRVELVNAGNSFSGDTFIRNGARLYLGNNLALQNSALDTGAIANTGTFGLSDGALSGRTTGSIASPSPVFGGLKGSRNLLASYSSSAPGNNAQLLAATAVTGLTLNPGAGQAHTYSGSIADFATGTTLTKTGLGIQILSGANTYTGATNINAGKLIINGSLSNAVAALNVGSGATLGGTGTIGRNVTISSGGKMEFDISSNAASHDRLDISAGRDFTMAAATELTITTSGGASPGIYTLVTGGNSIGGFVPAVINLPFNWVGTVSISGNSLLLNLASTIGDIFPPSLVDITDDGLSESIPANTPVTYTLTFSEDINASTVTAADFGNAGSAAISIGSISEVSPGVFTVTVTPTSGGTLRFMIIADAVLSDNAGNALNTTASIIDDRIITVVPPNSAPVASSQNVMSDEDTALPITLIATDAELDSLTYTIVTAPINGTLSGIAPNLTYTPDVNFNGADSFSFRANDGLLDSAIATVGITVNAVNDAPVAVAQSVTSDEDIALPITLSGTDVDLDSLTYTIVSPPSSGSLSGSAPNVTYTPSENFHGIVSFTFSVNDGTIDSTPATVSITVTPVNDAPVAVAQNVTTSEDTALPITLAATDVDGNPLTYSIVTQPTYGTLTGSPPSMVYSPDENSNGTDSFTFKANDGTLDSAIATVSITVTPWNDAPIAIAQSVTVDEDNVLPITLSGSDAENSPLTYTIQAQPANGTLSGSAPNLTYVPASNYNGADSFTFMVNDGTEDSNTATVSIAVTAINDAPVFATNPIALVPGSENVAYSGQTLAGLASDVDAGDTLNYSKISGPAWLSIDSNGSLSGTPPLGSAGINSFVVSVTDSASATASATLEINIATTALTWDANGLSAGQTNGAGAWLAANQWWNGSANQNWTSGANAIVGGPSTVGGAVTLASPTTVGAITFHPFSGTYTLGTTGNEITLNAGISKQAASGIATIISPLALSAEQTWTNQSVNALNISSPLNTNGNSLIVNGSGPINFATNSAAIISGSGGITMNGTGRLTLGANQVPLHSYTGTTTLNGGVTMVANNNLGPGNLTMNGGVIEGYWSSGFTRSLGSGAGQVQIIGGASGFALNGSTGMSVTLGNNPNNEAVWGSAHFNPSIFVLQTQHSQAGSTLNFRNGVDLNGSNRIIQVSGGASGSAAAVLSGVIRNSNGSAGITLTGNGIVYLQGNNTYNGTTTIQGGLIDFGFITLGGFGGGSGRNIDVAAGASVRRNSLNNAFLNRLVETNAEFIVMTGSTANNLDFGSSTGANLPNAFLGNWSPIEAKAEYTGIVSPAADAYRFGSPRSSGLLGIVSALTGTQGLIIGGNRVELVNASNSFSGDTVIRNGARLYLGNNLAMQNSALDTGSIANTGTFGLSNGAHTSRIVGSIASPSPVFGGLKGSRNLLSVYNANSPGSSAQLLAANAVTGFTLNPSSGQSHAYSGAIADFATGTTLTKTGLGTQILAGANTYTGATNINAGKLIINGSLSNTNAALNVAAGATLAGNGTIGRNVTIAESGRLEFDISTPSESHDRLDISLGRSFDFAGASELTITSSDGAQPGIYTLVTGGNNIGGVAPAVINLPANWVATVSISGNSLLLDVISTNHTPTSLASSTPSSSASKTTSASTLASNVSGAETSSNIRTEMCARTQDADTVLPLPWTSTDIGTGMLSGSTTHRAGTLTQRGSGIIGSSSDKLRFTYQTLTGDGEIVAKISSLETNGDASRAGVMIRDSLAANSMQIFLGMSGRNDFRWDSRTTTGGSTSTSMIHMGTVSHSWVKLVRSGATVSAYTSADGISWTLQGSTTNTTFAATCYIGLAVASGSDQTRDTSQFSNLNVAP